MDDKQKIYFITLCLLQLLILFIFHDFFLEKNTPLAQALQSLPKSFMDPLCSFLKLSGLTPIIYSIGLIPYFLGSNQTKNIIYLCVLVFGNYMLSMLKSMYAVPRPFFIFSQVHGESCSTEYGSPSGHALMTMVQFGGLLYLCKPEKKYPYYLCVIFIVMVGLSRVYFGVHGFHQILEGWTWGVIILITYSLIEQKLLVIILSKDKIENCTQVYTVQIGIFFSVSLLLNILAYIRAESKGIPSGWIAAVAPFCKHYPEPTSYFYFYNKGFVDAGQLGFVLALFLTTFFKNREVYGQQNYEHFMKEKQLNKFVLIKRQDVYSRFLVFMITNGVIGCCLTLFRTQIILTFIFQSVLTSVLIGLNTFLVLPQVYARLELAIPGEFMGLKGAKDSFVYSKQAHTDVLIDENDRKVQV